jgi:hypothetical protein
MGLRGFSVVSIMAVTMSLVMSLFATAQAFVRLNAPSTAPPVEGAIVPVALAFLAIGSLAGMARSTFRSQAEKIANLERRLAVASDGLTNRLDRA